ncbi:MAG: exodeoxyribonuclease VII large subunit [Lentimonas sp.]
MLDDLLKPTPDQILKVTDLTRHIKRLLEGNFKQVWVQGEVSNLRRQSSGHVYFSLKDTTSQIPCVLFARDAAAQNFELEDGMELQLLGDISVYEPHGRYQLVAKIAIRSGEGKLQLEFERLKRKLASEGLFEPSEKMELPAMPARIAVITSPTGAALRDFLRILRRRRFGGKVVVLPARVQGKGAADEILAMLKYASCSPNFDLIVMTRGGGSIEDLWVFNDEALARAVAASKLPIISAIGHEIDHVLTDYAADQRAETPSGAAELISSLYLQSKERLETAAYNLGCYAEASLGERARQLHDFKSRLRIIAPTRQIELQNLRLDDMENRINFRLRELMATNKQALDRRAQGLAEHHPQNRLRLASLNLKNVTSKLFRSVNEIRQHQRKELTHLATRLGNTSLSATLRRGYSILSNSDGDILDSAEKAARAARLKARFHDGKVNLKADSSES